MEYEEYEVIPTSPIKRLDKRLSRMEQTSSSSETRRLIEQVIELIKSNQRIIDDIVKSDAELRNEISRLPGKMDELMAHMGEFIDLLKTAASTEVAGKGSGELVKKMSQLIEQNKKTQEISQATLTSLETIDKRLKRMSVQQQAYRAPR